MQSRLLEALADRVLVYDGAMGTQIQAAALTAEDFGGKRWEGCNDYLSLTRPQERSRARVWAISSSK